MGKIRVERSQVFDIQMIREIYVLDKMVYSEHMAGSVEDDVRRYEKAPEAFILLKDDEKIIGYLCFFPVSNVFFKKMLEEDIMYDNNIGPDDIAYYEKGKHHHIFIISMVINPNYKGQGYFKDVLSMFKDCLVDHHLKHEYISDISGYAVSGAGSHILESLGCQFVKAVEDEGEIGNLYIGNFEEILEAYKL